MCSIRPLLALALAAGLSSCGSSNAQQQPNQPQTTPVLEQASAAPPPQVPQKTLKIYLSLDSLDELRIAEGMVVTTGQTLADRGRERSLLESQQQRLINQLQVLKVKEIRDPLPPKPTSMAAELPPTHFEEQEAELQKAISKQQAADHKLDLQKRQTDYLRGITDTDPAIIEHEGHKQDALKQELLTASSDIDLAKGKLQSAKDNRAYREYEHQLAIQHQEEARLAAEQSYERAEQESLARHQEHDLQLSQLNARLQDLELKLAQAPIVRSPVSGLIKKLRFKHQNESKILVEVELVVSGWRFGSPSNPIPNPSQRQDLLPVPTPPAPPQNSQSGGNSPSSITPDDFNSDSGSQQPSDFQ